MLLKAFELEARSEKLEVRSEKLELKDFEESIPNSTHNL
ncbi:MAG: hypothetical protein ACJAUD_001517 [Crocinitomicaceae bacterium]|jgi:hypothetical protein